MRNEPYLFGADSATSRSAVRELVESYLEDHLDDGPGWIVTHGDDAYDIKVTVTLYKKGRVVG